MSSSAVMRLTAAKAALDASNAKAATARQKAAGRVDLHAAGGTRRVAAVVIPLYLVRTWLMNCTAGLTKSVLNDYVPKRHRAKWNSLESLNVFSWSGSAALGGLLRRSAQAATPSLATSE